MQVTGLLPILALASAGAGDAQPTSRSQPAQLQALLQCRAIAAAEARLQCYDAALGAFVQATEAGALVVVDQQEIRRTRRSLFGFGLPSLPLFGGREDGGEPSEIEAPIRSARAFEYDKWVITLEDGAVWQTTESNSRSIDPRAGDTATIRKGALGRYTISWPGSRSISAKRIR